MTHISRLSLASAVGFIRNGVPYVVEVQRMLFPSPISCSFRLFALDEPRGTCPQLRIVATVELFLSTSSPQVIDILIDRATAQVHKDIRERMALVHTKNTESSQNAIKASALGASASN